MSARVGRAVAMDAAEGTGPVAGIGGVAGAGAGGTGTSRPLKEERGWMYSRS